MFEPNKMFSRDNILDGLIFYAYFWIVISAMGLEQFDPHPISLLMVPLFSIGFIYLAFSLRRDDKKIAPRNKLILYGAILFFVCYGLRFFALTR